MNRLLLSILVCGTIGLTPATQAEGAKFLSVSNPGDMPGYVTFSFDDATLSQYTEAFPILEEAGISATLFVNVGAVDVSDPFFMNWDQVRHLHVAGWEIGSHGMLHTELPKEDDVTLVGNLELSILRLQDEVGEQPRSFASPFGEYDERTLSFIARLFDLHVRAWGSNDGVNATDVGPLLIERFNVDGGLTADEVCSKVGAVQQGQWLVLMFHQIGEPTGAYISGPEQLKSIARCVADAARDGKIIADTVSAVYDDINPEKE